MTDTIYVDYETVVAINAEHCGAGAGVRDESGIRAALGRAEASFGGIDLVSSLTGKAAVILHGLSSTQYFHDGNKRTAWLVTKLFLALNGHYLRDLSDVEAEAFVLAIATRAFENDGDPNRGIDRAADWYETTRRSGIHRHIDSLIAANANWGLSAIGMDNGTAVIDAAFLSGFEIPETPVQIQIFFVCQIRGFAEDAGQMIRLLLDVDPRDRAVADLFHPTPEAQQMLEAGDLVSIDTTRDVRNWHEEAISIVPARDMPWLPNGVHPVVYMHPLWIRVQRPGLIRLRLYVDGELYRTFPVTFAAQNVDADL